ncbi:MAG: hypothetical protein RIR70_1680 [Pseudomonadota bacterium]
MGASISRLNAIHHAGQARANLPGAEDIWHSLKPWARPPEGFLSIEPDLRQFPSRLRVVPHNTALRLGSDAAREVPLALTTLLQGASAGGLDDVAIALLFQFGNDMEKLEALATLSRHGLIDLTRKIETPPIANSQTLVNFSGNTKRSLPRMLAEHGIECLEPDWHHGMRLIDRIRLLRDCGIGLDAPVKRGGLTLLHCAVRTNNTDTISALLCAGASGEPRDVRGMTALMLAAKLGRAGAVVALAKGGVELEAALPASGLRALHIAAAHDQGDTIRALAEMDADMDALSHQGVAAIHMAASRGRCESLRALTAPRNEEDARPWCDLELPTAGKQPGVTALMIATLADKPEAVRVLLEAGADPACRFGTAQSSPVIAAARLFKRAALQALLDKGCDPNLTDADGNTPLHYAVNNFDQRATDALIKAGANPDMTNRHGHRPIDIAKNGRIGLWGSLSKAHREAGLPVPAYVSRAPVGGM